MPRNTSVLPASGPQHAAARPGSRPPRIIDRALTRLVTIGVAAVALLSVTSPASAAPTIYVGAVGDVATLSKQTGSPLAWHTYSEFTRNVPTGADMISVRYPGVSWRQVANASAGSAIHNNIVRWAQTVKSRGPIMIAFHHEPEAKGSTGYGTSADFIAAYRKVVDIFNAQGATNVHWVWQMTDYAFRVSATDRRAAAKWYPGDGYVDNVGADGYNWGSCYGHSGAWQTVASFTDPVLKFARAHGKKASLPEFGAFPGTRRADWLRDVHRYLVANRDVMTAAFYFHVPPGGPGCNWKLNTAAEYDAYGDISRDATYFKS